MLRISDAHFRTGASHLREGTPCQDYAMAGAGRGRPFGIVSDGCSTSGRTDVGARIWATACASVLRRFDIDNDGFRDFVESRVMDCMTRLDLQHSDMDATLLAVQAGAEGGGRAILIGDGVMFATHPDGHVETLEVDWVGSMPGYPSYLLGDRDRRCRFADQSESMAADLGRAPCVVNHRLYSSTGELLKSAQHDRSADDGLEGVTFNYPMPLALLAVASDGAAQVSGLSTHEIVSQMSSIGQATGSFAVRRLNRMMTNLVKVGNIPEDDISFAALVA